MRAPVVANRSFPSSILGDFRVGRGLFELQEAGLLQRAGDRGDRLGRRELRGGRDVQVAELAGPGQHARFERGGRAVVRLNGAVEPAAESDAVMRPKPKALGQLTSRRWHFEVDQSKRS